jgi:5-methylcytosine-specific restriction endonuclease McrA
MVGYVRKVRPEPKKPHLVTDEDRQRGFVVGNYPRNCLQCGTGYNYHPAAKDKGHEHKRGLFCSWDCKSQHIKDSKPGPHSKLQVNPCKTCGKVILSKGAKRYCSDECKPKILALPPMPRVCRHCKGSYLADNTGGMHKQYCSEGCRNEVEKVHRRIARSKRKAIIRKVTIEKVDPFVVFDRDGWKCKMCGIDTPKELRGTIKSNAPELDHVMPISKGGSHSYMNTQCSCRKCNQVKSDKILPNISADNNFAT